MGVHLVVRKHVGTGEFAVETVEGPISMAWVERLFPRPPEPGSPWAVVYTEYSEDAATQRRRQAFLQSPLGRAVLARALELDDEFDRETLLRQAAVG